MLKYSNIKILEILNMKIIVIGPDYEKYNAASYQYEFMNSLKEISEKYFHYSENNKIDLDDLCIKSKFTPDVIFFNHGWLHDNPSYKSITYGIISKKLSNKKIKQVIFLNKEYTRLNEKLNEIKHYKFDLIFSHLHDFYKLNNTSIDSKFLPLACSYANICQEKNKKLENRKYDLFFSGILQNWNFKNKQNDLRKQIQFELFYCFFDFPVFKKFKYWNLIIYWKPFYKNRFKNIFSDLLHGKRLSQKDYFKILSNSKCVLHTSSPIGIISTRVFEALGSGAIGMFSSDSNADVIFEDGTHFLSFFSIKNLIYNLYLVKNSKGNSKFQKIANSGRELVEKKHTWRNRVAFFIDEVLKLS